MDPRTPYLLQKYFNELKKNMDIFYNNNIFVNLGILNSDFSEQ